jgi:hypothetical protein
VKLHNVPWDWAMILVAAGVRISWAQLLDAANSKVAGVEVWVQVQQQRRVHMDIPPAAVIICCRKSRNWASGGDLWGLNLAL